MANKNSFVLQTRLNAVVAKLSDKQAGVLFKSILNYAVNGTVATFEDSAVDIAFEFVKQDIDYATAKYEQTCKRNAENGKLGGRPKKQMLNKKAVGFNENPKKANGFFEKHNDNDNDVDNELVDKSTNIITPLPPLGELAGKTLSKAFARWLDYRKQIKKPYKSKMSIAECYARLEKLSGGDLAIAEKIVSQSIAQGWQGLFELKDGGKENAGIDYNRNPDEDKYDGFGRKI